jgi:hypothetical protein
MSTTRNLSLALLITTFIAWTGSSQAIGDDDQSVSGVFKGNGKEAKLAFASAHKGEPFADKPTTVLVFTEKDHSKDKKPEIKAGFGDFGSALIFTIDDEGKIVGCVIAHKAHKKSGFSSVGNSTLSDFKRDGGKIQGKISTKGEQEFFGDTWEINLKFQVRAP